MFLRSRQQGRSETEEYSSDSESESEDEEELQMILEDLQKQNEELEVRKHPASTTCCGGPAVFGKIVVIHIPEAQHAFVSGNKIVKVLAGVLQDLILNVYFVALKNKNTHLNQAIHEEQEAILELRVQLRLLQSHKLQQELTAQPPAEQAPPTQPSPEARSDEQTKRSVAAVAPTADAAAATTNGKAAKDPSKPSPNKDKRDTNM